MRRYTFTDGAGTVRELTAPDAPRAMTAAGSYELRRSGSLAAAELAAGTVAPIAAPAAREPEPAEPVVTSNGDTPRCTYCGRRTRLVCGRCKRPLCGSHIDVHAADAGEGCQPREVEAMQNGS